MYIKIIFFLLISNICLYSTELDDKKIIKDTINNEIKNNLFLNTSKYLIKKYYKNSNYKLFWFEDKKPKKIAYDLIKKIETDEVLKPKIDEAFIEFAHIKKRFEQLDEESDIIALDIKLTDIYHKYMGYLANGFISWENFENELLYIQEEKEINISWQKYRKFINLRKLLYEISKNNDLSLATEELENSFFNTFPFTKKIKEYEDLQANGGFIKIKKVNHLLKEGYNYIQIKNIRKRLIQSKYLEDFACNFDELYCSNFYDKDLETAIKEFQNRHSLDVDGLIGKDTINALNIPIKEKIKKLRVNLERLRLLPKDFGEKFIYVNIPEYKLKLYNEKNKEFETAVIVGQKENPTPIFSHQMSEIIVNPYWKIPQTIVKKEIIPKLIENPNYLEEENIKVFENWDVDSIQYDVSSVDWSMYEDNDLIGDDKEAPMRFIQFPNDKNPLGKMKFMFPNRYSVYLHDTPFKYLFNTSSRAFSHGCIRVDKPSQLLTNILKYEKNYEGIDYEQLFEISQRINLDLEEKVPVHIVYLTAWADDNQNIHFANDIYGFDDIQADILYNPNYEKKELEPKTLSASVQ